MPKIAYEIGIDPQRKVTKEWIQDKLNAAKALMQGRIDEENLCADNPEQLMKTIKDRPTEVVAYDNCMKFFQRVGTPEEQSLGDHTPVVDLFAMLVNLCKASPDVAVVGGTLDSEMVSTFTTEDSSADGSDTQTSYTDVAVVGGTLDSEMVSTFTTEDLKDSDDEQKSFTDIVARELEVPSNYIPMIWGELADLMIQNNFELTEIQINQETGELSLVNKTVAEAAKKKYILDEILDVGESDYVAVFGYSINWSKSKTNVNYYINTRDKTCLFGADVYAPVLFPKFGLPEIFFDSAKSMFSCSNKIQYFKTLAKIKNEYSDEDDYKYVKSSGATTVRFIPEFLCKVV